MPRKSIDPEPEWGMWKGPLPAKWANQASKLRRISLNEMVSKATQAYQNGGVEFFDMVVTVFYKEVEYFEEDELFPTLLDWMDLMVTHHDLDRALSFYKWLGPMLYAIEDPEKVIEKMVRISQEYPERENETYPEVIWYTHTRERKHLAVSFLDYGLTGPYLECCEEFYAKETDKKNLGNFSWHVFLKLVDKMVLDNISLVWENMITNSNEPTPWVIKYFIQLIQKTKAQGLNKNGLVRSWIESIPARLMDEFVPDFLKLDMLDEFQIALEAFESQSPGKFERFSFYMIIFGTALRKKDVGRSVSFYEELLKHIDFKNFDPQIFKLWALDIPDEPETAPELIEIRDDMLRRMNA